VKAGVLTVVLGACSIVMALSPPAQAVVSDPELIDGPSSDLVGEPDAAMSEDGTGGVVYLKRIDGRSHVFASQFTDGEWGSPQRVDVGQSFDSSWPRIAAGDNGRLLVTWVQDFGVQTDRMFSATMDPGAGGFQGPVPVDFAIGKATSTFPDLAMARGGQAYLVYNVVTDTSASNPPGYVGLDVRLARYSNRLWSLVGSRVDRNASIPVPIPTTDTAPRLGIDVQGQAVVAWLEPDDEFVDRVWARRVFGSQTGIPLPVSPDEWEGQPLRGAVSGFSLDVAGFGQATVAFTQLPGQVSTLDAARVMVNGMPDIFTEGASSFGEAQIADEIARGSLGAPAVAVDPSGVFSTAFPSGSATLLSSGDDFSIYGVERIDQGVSSTEASPQVDIAESGAGVAAWQELRTTGGAVAVQERRADGVFESTALSAPSGGSPGPPTLSGSGLGDAVIAWSQGTGGTRQIAATVVDAPPDPFLVLVPSGWKRDQRIRVAWDPSPHAIGGVTYSLSVDDEPVLDGVEAERARLGPRAIEDGKHRIQVFAVDSAGQETGSLTGRVSVDRTAPKARLKRRGRVVSVEIDDGARSVSSGLSNGEVSFGDGYSVKAKADAGTTARQRHRFDRPGRYRVRVEAKDRAGNALRESIEVRIR
jgi:hypothetical protein